MSSIVRQYLRLVPFERGKTRLRKVATAFAVGQLETGAWIRVTGLSDFEWQVFIGTQKEPTSSAFFRRLLRPGMTVFDVGANIGYYSLQAAPLVGREGGVHAFEPTPRLARRVEQNAALNGFTNVRVTAAGVSDEVGTMQLHFSREDSEANSIFVSGEAYDAVEVPVTTLDAYATAHGIDRVDVAKVDCEGAEVLVVRGAQRLLTGPGAPLLLIEVNPTTLRRAGTSADELLGALRGCGYHCHLLERLTSGPDAVFNAVATKEGMQARFPALGEFSLTALEPA